MSEELKPCLDILYVRETLAEYATLKGIDVDSPEYRKLQQEFNRINDLYEASRRTYSIDKLLTLEQLKQMDGEPVYIVFLLEPDKSEWKLIDGHTEKCTLFRSDYSLYNDGYSKTWLAYAHKPVNP